PPVVRRVEQVRDELLSGVVDKYVDAAVGRDRLGDETGGVIGPADVSRGRLGHAAARPNRLDGVLEWLWPAARDDDGRPLPRELLGRREADARSAAGDERDLPGKPAAQRNRLSVLHTSLHTNLSTASAAVR